jgi:hypothetical protein
LRSCSKSEIGNIVFSSNWPSFDMWVYIDWEVLVGVGWGVVGEEEVGVFRSR